MVEAEETIEEDIEVEVDTEEVTKEIIKEHQINKVEIMVQNSKEKGIMKIKQPQQNNGNQWNPSQVVCYKCFGRGHYSSGCTYRG